MKNLKGFDGFLNEGRQGTGNKFVIVRFGTRPERKVAEFFRPPHIIGKPTLFAGNGMYTTVFETTMSKEQLKEVFDQMEIRYDLYQLVDSANTTAGRTRTAAEPTAKELEALLKKAVKAENYEEATRLRDKLAEMGVTANSSESLKMYERFINEAINAEIKIVKNSKGVEFKKGTKTDYGTIDSFEEKDGVIYANVIASHKTDGPSAEVSSVESKNKKKIDDLKVLRAKDAEITEESIEDAFERYDRVILSKIENFKTEGSVKDAKYTCTFNASIKGVWMKGQDERILRQLLSIEFPGFKYAVERGRFGSCNFSIKISK